MMEKSRSLVVAALATSWLACWPKEGEPFEGATHAAMTRQAVAESAKNQSQADAFLKAKLALPKGLNDIVGMQSIAQLIANGSVEEDSPFNRVVNHFHDPTQPFSDAGLRLGPVKIGESSVVWGQDDGSSAPPGTLGAGNEHAWQKARLALFNAFTPAAGSDRLNQDELAAMFDSLGHLIHLVQDAASPAHTRNDRHLASLDLVKVGQPLPRISVVNERDGFHRWADQPLNLLSIDGTVGLFDPAILSIPPSAGSPAPIPIARLIDTEVYRATGTPPGGLLAGIAEYSNANFLSDATTSGQYLNPSLDPDTLSDERVPGTDGDMRMYFHRPLLGGEVAAMAVPSALYGFTSVPLATQSAGLDDTVFAAYSQLLFPRAIGYSAGLLDYFFRDPQILEIAAPDRFAYGIASGGSGVFTSLKFKLRNASTDVDMGPGEVKAVVRYRKTANGEDLLQNPFAPLSSEYSYAASAVQAVTPDRNTFKELRFDFSRDPIPTTAADVVIMAVYMGPLLDKETQVEIEPNGVVLGIKDVFEPDPFDLINTSDYQCLDRAKGACVLIAPGTCNDACRFVDGICVEEEELVYTPTHSGSRDIDEDGTQDIFGPFGITNTSVNTGPFLVAPDPTPQDFDYAVASLPAGAHARFLILQDRPSYSPKALVGGVEGSGDSGPAINLARFRVGVRNDLFTLNDEKKTVVRRVSYFNLQRFRGLTIVFGNLFVESKVNSLRCVSRLERDTLLVPLEPVSGEVGP